MIERSLREVYRATLARCAPAVLARERIRRGDVRSVGLGEVDIAALGKCAAGLAEGAGSVPEIGRVFVAAPAGYADSVELPTHVPLEIVEGSHPDLSSSSFRAGERLVAFVESANRPIVFLISGGSSACVEMPFGPWFDEDDLITANHALIRAGLPIASINRVRRHLSAIKGGRLGSKAPVGSMTLIFSDVSSGRFSDVGSGPTLTDGSTNAEASVILRSLGDRRCDDIAERLSSATELPEHSHASRCFLIADNGTLRAAAADEAARIGMTAQLMDSDLEDDVAVVSGQLVAQLRTMARGHLLIAGGEPTVLVRGDGAGGRCSELALRFAMDCDDAGIEATALFAGSDGLDGNSGAAGIVLSCGARGVLDRKSIEKALTDSDSFTLAAQLGSPLFTGPTGNNLRDLYLMARK